MNKRMKRVILAFLLSTLIIFCLEVRNAQQDSTIPIQFSEIKNLKKY